MTRLSQASPGPGILIPEFLSLLCFTASGTAPSPCPSFLQSFPFLHLLRRWPSLLPSRPSVSAFTTWGFPGGSEVKKTPANALDAGLIPGSGRAPGCPLQYCCLAWLPTPVLLPGESPWTEEPGGLQSTGSQRVGHYWATKQQQQSAEIRTWCRGWAWRAHKRNGLGRAGKLIGRAKEDVQGLTWECEQVSRWSKINSACCFHHPSSKPCPPDQEGFLSLPQMALCMPRPQQRQQVASAGSCPSPTNHPSLSSCCPGVLPPPPSPGLAAGSPSQCPAPRVPLACCYLLQDHLQHCLFQPVQCSNENCQEPVLRKDLKEHLSAFCRFREEKCIYCKKDVVVINLQVKKKKSIFMGLNSVWVVTVSQMGYQKHFSKFIFVQKEV